MLQLLAVHTATQFDRSIILYGTIGLDWIGLDVAIILIKQINVTVGKLLVIRYLLSG